jgi:capsular polysaccharide export protein
VDRREREVAGLSEPAWAGREIAVFSAGIHRIRSLEQFLDNSQIVYRPSARRAASVDYVAGWGTKETTRVAEDFALRFRKPLLRLEDGFFRSVRTGGEEPPLSLVIDDLGIYYDGNRPSRLEAILNAEASHDPLGHPAVVERARAARERVRKAALSKYNDAPLELPAWLDDVPAPYVLVVDQTLGDEAVKRGNLSEDGFARMLDAALAEHPDETIVVKTHPEVARGKKRGYLSGAASRSPRVRLLASHASAIRVLERASHVYVGTSQLGFEALMLGKKVSCFGTPFYSGWGLTDDRVPLARRTRRRSLDELAAAAWILYPRYVDPVRRVPCELEDVLSHLELQRRRFEENAGVVRAYGFSWWKRPYVRRYLGGPSTELRFERRLPAAAPAGRRPTRVVVWGRRGPGELEVHCQAEGIPLFRMEDGFLRSVGLGADLTAPASLVLDQAGMYFDPRGPSDLEEILQTGTFSEEDKARARALRESIVRARLSKYNPPGGAASAGLAARGRRVLLVPGQVEDDASVVLGGAGIHTNGGLVRAVREARPDAFLLYRPHPDVVSGNRRGQLSKDDAARVDQVASGMTLESCLAAADEVHTLTSLVGFEALLRGLPVSVYGQPFYAGWGLTADRVSVPRRTRRLDLDELTCGTLVRYPRYYSFAARAFVKAEDVVFELTRDRSAKRSIPLEATWAIRQLLKLWGWSREVRDAR